MRGSPSGGGEIPASVERDLSHFSRVEEQTMFQVFSMSAMVVLSASCMVLFRSGTLFRSEKRTRLFDSCSPSPDQLFPVLALVDELVCQSPNLPVLECYLPIIGDEQDTVIGNGFLTIWCPDTQVTGFKADAGTAHSRPVVFCALVTIPDLDFANIVAVIVPGLLQEGMAGYHGTVSPPKNYS